jgi:hypothetical protein
LLDQLASVEERERTLLAEAIHDGPLQLVLGVKMRLDTISRRGQSFDSEETQRLAGTLEIAMQHLRTLIIALTRPTSARDWARPCATWPRASSSERQPRSPFTVPRTSTSPTDQGQRLPDPP